MSLKRYNPMARGGRLQRNPVKIATALDGAARSGAFKRLRRRYALAPISKKRKGGLREYFKVRASYLADHPTCEAGPILMAAEMPAYYQRPKCDYASREIHHTQGRGPNLCNVETFCAICAPCHRFLHAHGQKARELGLLL